MIIVTVLSLIISFLLQGICSNYSLHLAWFFTVYPLINLLILIPYFDNRRKCLTLVIIVGLFIDILYSNVLFLNVGILLVVYFFSRFFHSIFPYNLFTLSISNLISICIYHILNFLILWIFQYGDFHFLVSLKILYRSIFMTLIYGGILYFIIKFIYEKFELREIK